MWSIISASRRTYTLGITNEGFMQVGDCDDHESTNCPCEEVSSQTLNPKPEAAASPGALRMWDEDVPRSLDMV